CGGCMSRAVDAGKGADALGTIAAVKWTGKVVGGLLGMLTLGPLGAAVGVLLGHQFDEHADGAEAEPRLGSAADVAAIGERFFRATFRVMGYLAKADGRVPQQEMGAARAVMDELHLDGAQVREAIACFTAGKQPDFDPRGELAALRGACRGRPDLLRVFLEIQVRAALEGNNLEGPVRPLMGRVATSLGVSPLELVHVEAVARIRRGAFRADETPASPAARDRALEAAYRVLGTDAGAR